MNARTKQSVWFDAVVAVTVVTCLTALEARAAHGAQWFLSFSELVRGPFLGWRIAAREGHVVDALFLLVTATVGTLVPLGFFAHRGSRPALVCGAVAWFFSGHYFGIGMWI